MRKGVNKELYNAWTNMRQRCSNSSRPEYINYGGRGITVCAEWQEYDAFAEWAFVNGYEKGLTLDRENNMGVYEPDNCRWVNRKVQNNNRRYCHQITIGGETKTLKQWVEDKRCPFKYPTVFSRLFRGWAPRDAIFGRGWEGKINVQ